MFLKSLKMSKKVYVYFGFFREGVDFFSVNLVIVRVNSTSSWYTSVQGQFSLDSVLMSPLVT